jgi:hypothetical protein
VSAIAQVPTGPALHDNPSGVDARMMTLTTRLERDPEMAHSDIAADTVGVGASALAAQRGIATPLFDDLPAKSRLVDRLVVH